MENVRKPTHGFEIVLISRILEEFHLDLPPGQIYGFQRCLAGLPVSGIDNSDIKEVELELLSNTTRSNSLQAGRKYYAPVRVTKSSHEHTYIGIYNPQCTIPLGLANETCVESSNKLHTCGFGVVTDRKEKIYQIANNPETILSCTVRHNEWNPQERLQVTFNVTYIVRKKGTSNNFFGLFQVGREIGISGPLIDWDEENESWVVLVTGVSLSSAQQSMKSFISNPQVEDKKGNNIRRVVTKKSKKEHINIQGSPIQSSTILNDADLASCSKIEPQGEKLNFRKQPIIKLEKDFNPKDKTNDSEDGEISEMLEDD
ncbi:hypothetical protein O181_078381 [Austropuccinia psidii MF-1]|uniref:Uncharacterized protein n=1 Tax=Austropuccinia psidii MF-1 TaxID=1389203 RepID=A0A9Q3FE76_9BASI|nr:hypothetical protein [Austropuccinia psidii MF-1]